MATRDDHKAWTDHERDAIRRVWPDIDDLVLPGRSERALRSEAWRMGLRKPEPVPYFTTRPVNSVFDYADALGAAP